MTHKNRFQRRGEHGQSTVEYALIIVLLAIAAILTLAVVGVSLNDVYCRVIAGLSGRTDPTNCIVTIDDVDEIDVLYNESFDSLDNWDLRNTGWVIVDGELRNEEDGEHQAKTGDDTWDNYTITIGSADLQQGNGYGVYFRVHNEPDFNGYAFQFDPGYRGGRSPNGSFIIRKITNGRESPPIAHASAPLDHEWYNQVRRLVINVRDDTFTVFMDGEKILTGTDDSYPRGRIGLRTWDSTRASFDNLSVSR
jgi:Flp pilus assembly pilin Flp